MESETQNLEELVDEFINFSTEKFSTWTDCANEEELRLLVNTLSLSSEICDTAASLNVSVVNRRDFKGRGHDAIAEKYTRAAVFSIRRIFQCLARLSALHKIKLIDLMVNEINGEVSVAAFPDCCALLILNSAARVGRAARHMSSTGILSPDELKMAMHYVTKYCLDLGMLMRIEEAEFLRPDSK